MKRSYLDPRLYDTSLLACLIRTLEKALVNSTEARHTNSSRPALEQTVESSEKSYVTRYSWLFCESVFFIKQNSRLTSDQSRIDNARWANPSHATCMKRVLPLFHLLRRTLGLSLSFACITSLQGDRTRELLSGARAATALVPFQGPNTP